MAQADDGTGYLTDDAERERHWERVFGNSSYTAATAHAVRIQTELRSLLAQESAAARGARNDSRPGGRQSARLQADIDSNNEPLIWISATFYTTRKLAKWLLRYK